MSRLTMGTGLCATAPVEGQTKFYWAPAQEAMYTTLLMSTGLTFGTISSLFGRSHGIVNPGQYSALVAAVIGSAVETEAIIKRSRQYFSALLEPIQARLAKSSPRPVFHVLVGHSSEQIVRYAEGNGIDHTVVGHRGHTRFDRWLIGSVARQLGAYAKCTVTIVRK